MNQFLLVTVALRKPAALADGTKDPFKAFAVDYSLGMRVSASGLPAKGNPPVVVSPNVSHAREVRCPPHADWCAPVVLFIENFLEYPAYRLDVELERPLADFGNVSRLVPSVEYRLELTFVSAASTQAEMGFRYFCFTTGLLSSLAFLVSLCRWSHNRAAWSLEQRWLLVLLVGATLFSNPLVLASVYSPALVWSLINTFVTVTFVFLLLTFWLTYTHAVVLAAAKQRSTTASLSLTASFFLPKLVFMTFFYAAALFGAASVVFRLETDPAFSLWDDAPYPAFVIGLATAVAVVYILWLAVYAAFALRAACARRLSRQFLFYLATSFTALLAVLGAYFGGALLGTSGTVPTLTLFAAGNLYVWVLAFAHLPGLEARGGGAFTDRTASERASVARAGAAEDDSQGILGDTIGDSDADELVVELGVSTEPGRGAGGAAAAGSFAVHDEEDEDEDDGPGAASGPSARGARRPKAAGPGSPIV